MEMNVLKKEKNEMEIEFDNLTFPEILRVYLNKDSAVHFAAWKKSHSTKNPVLLVKTKGKDVKTAIEGAVKAIVKDLDKVEDDFSKLK
ncbi:MAG: RpoL/Rpb11 RNA polymerase subunit family protein [archaeon]|nr:RpoL/Rpb11 RNA polymerase subunit family protein [archaeon]